MLGMLLVIGVLTLIAVGGCLIAEALNDREDFY